jgi:adenylate cyclase
MVDFIALHRDINEEVSIILAPDFKIDVTKTSAVPHSDAAAITFPNLDQKTQGTKFIETAVLYVDMRRSTALSMKHRRHTVAKLYSAFVRAITRCADGLGGEVRGIIGDRVMVLFNEADCYTNAVDTAILINSVCQYVLNKYFVHNEVTFGIGIDHGTMLATKTGIRRHGSAQQSYRSLVWLGRPANIASKLTDNANKPAENIVLDKVRVTYRDGLFGGLRYADQYANEFLKQFRFNVLTNTWVHQDPSYVTFQMIEESCTLKIKTPPILMSKQIYDGFRAARPDSPCLLNGWFEKIVAKIPEYTGEVYGGDVIYTIFRDR